MAPRGHLAVFGDIFGCPNRGVCLLACGRRSQGYCHTSCSARDGAQQRRIWTTTSAALRLRNPGVRVCVCVCVCVCVKVSVRAGAVGVPTLKFVNPET